MPRSREAPDTARRGSEDVDEGARRQPPNLRRRVRRLGRAGRAGRRRVADLPGGGLGAEGAVGGLIVPESLAIVDVVAKAGWLLQPSSQSDQPKAHARTHARR